MGIFDIFKKKKKPIVEKIPSNGIVPYKSNQLSDPTKYFSIHHDIKDLIWIGNGPKKNFIADKAQGDVYHFEGFTITISISGREEPSLIYMNQDIKESKEKDKVPSPSYFPNYKVLSPEQKYQYWQFLSNPYEPSTNISYVFILYYGLERHLFMHNFEDAMKVVIRLREVHKNGSFQSYSGNAIVLSCLLHQRADMMQLFMNSLNEEYKRGFSDNLYLLGMHSFDNPLTAKEIMRLSKTFGFTNTNYIKGYPELFKETMEAFINEKYSANSLILKELVPNIESLPKKGMRLFANMSLSAESVNVPDLVSSNELQQATNALLIDTHESVKKQLSEMRKKKVAPKKKEAKKPQKKMIFDASEESRLLKELKKNYREPVMKHFTYIQLQDFYYKFRELDPKYLEECIKYCYEDIELLDHLNEAYIKKEIERQKQLKEVYLKEQIDNEIKRIKEEKFQGRIPAFSRLAIIYEKRKEYDYAISISQQAIDYYENQGMNAPEFEERIERLQGKQRN
jgi:hypothetical protein